MGTNSDTALATQQSIKAYADLKLPLAGGTMSGNVDFGDNDITNVDSFDADKLSIAGGTEMTSIKDEDNMASDSNVALATQQSIKAYVDSQVGGADTLQEVTDNGATTTNAIQLGSNLGISGNTFFEGSISGTGTVTVLGNITTDGDVTTDNSLVRDNIQHVGDLTNEISFASATQDFRTNNGSRLDISNSGVRLGGANSRVTTILDEDAMGTNSDTALATQQSIKTYADTKLPLAGGTMTGNVDFGDNDITNVDSFDADKLSIAGGTEMTSIKDEDNMASDSNVALATQQSIKAYADTKLPLAGGTMSGNVDFGDNDISFVVSPTCWILSLIRALSPVTSPSVVILPNTVTLPVPDKAPSKNVFPLIPKLLPSCIAFVVVAPLSVTSCKVSDVATCESTYALIDC